MFQDLLSLHGKEDEDVFNGGIDEQPCRISHLVVNPVQPYLQARVVVIEITVEGIIKP